MASIQRIRELLAPDYTVDRELGRGGMATVYLAQDARHQRVVALKVLHPDLAASVGTERFLREIRVAARPAGARATTAGGGSGASHPRPRGGARLCAPPGRDSSGRQTREHHALR